jgi:hypothetical protein
MLQFTATSMTSMHERTATAAEHSAAVASAYTYTYTYTYICGLTRTR